MPEFAEPIDPDALYMWFGSPPDPLRELWQGPCCTNRALNGERCQDRNEAWQALQQATDRRSAFNSFRRSVWSVEGAEVVDFEANFTHKQEGTMPPLSVLLVVEGGEDLAVGQAILRVLPVAFTTVGNTQVECEACEVPIRVRFSRPGLK